jgi:uncharacterized protein (DUF433 family)
MSISFAAEPVPLKTDEHGDIRIGDSRVLLDLVVEAFENGATPETIAQMYSTLNLVDVYGAITYYLRHRQEVQDYLLDRGRRSEEIRHLIQAEQLPMHEIRQRLLDRKLR